MLSDILSKVLTVLVDRRLWFTVVLPFIVIYAGFPEEEVKPYIEAVYLLVSSVALNLSWATRPPSGRNFKDEMVKVYEKLRELGVIK